VSESASLLLFGDEQISFPGIPRCAAEPRAEPRGESEAESGAESPPAGVLLCPGQLCLGPSQLLLADADPEPMQPSLLPEPPPWELVEPSSPRAAHHPDMPARLPQLPLFPRQG
jgi:hypothetical protein